MRRRSTRLAEVVRRRGRVALGWAVLSGVVAALVVAALLWFAPFLRVQSVDYRTEPARMAALKESVPAPVGKPLVQVDTGALRDQVLATRLFDSVSVTRSWPSTLVVHAVPRSPVVAVSGGGVRGVRLVDRGGVAYETVSSAPAGVPEATAASATDSPALASLATVVSGLDADLLAQMDDLHLDAGGRVSMTLKGVSVTWGDATDSRVKAAVVRDLVSRADVARIDVSAPLTPVTSSDRSTNPTGTSTGGAASKGPSSGSRTQSSEPRSGGEATHRTDGAGASRSPSQESPTASSTTARRQ